MASFTQNVAEQFPAGTTVGAFRQSNWPFGSQPPAGAPLGSPDTSGVVAADGSLALTLTGGVAYFLTNTSGTPGQLGYVRVFEQASASAAGAKIDFRAASGGSWASMPLAVTELGGSTSVRAWIDLSLYTQARIVANVSTIGTAGAVFAVQYSTDSGSTWNYLDGASGPSVSIAALGTVKSGYVALAAGALGEVLVRCVGSGGNGATSPGFGLVYVEFKP